MIIQIRGTSGSGKSTAMRRVMESLGQWHSKFVEGRKRPLLYHTANGNDWGRVVVLGHYESACGGCDTIGSAAAVYDECMDVVEGNGPVPILCEGLLLSEDVKWTTQLNEHAPPIVALFLVTPLDRCLENIKTRRAAAGNERELNEANTANRVATIERARVKLLAAGVDCRRCSADQAPGIVLKLLRLHAQGGNHGPRADVAHDRDGG